MPRRSKVQIAIDCGLAPGMKPTAFQIRQSKELTRTNAAIASTSNIPKNKAPKVKIPQPTSTPFPSQSRLPPSSSALKPSSKPRSNQINQDIESEDLEITEPANNPRFTTNDLDHLLGLMALQENQDCLFGSGSITAVDGMTRSGCWETLGTLMNVYHNDQNKKSSSHAMNKMRLTGDEMMKRWNRIKKRYVDTKKYFENSTGTGILDQDLAKGIDTTEKKKELMCPRYEVIHEIIGHKANITAHSILDTARPPRRSIQSEGQIDLNSVIDPSLNASYHSQGDCLDQDSDQYPEHPEPEPSSGQRQPSIHLEAHGRDFLSSSDLALDDPTPEPEKQEPSGCHQSDRRSSSPDLPNIESPISEGEVGETQKADQPTSNSNYLDPPQSIKKASRLAIKRKRGDEGAGGRPMRPLPSVNPNPGRHKAPAAAMIKDRDESRFKYFDRKMDEKKRYESDASQTQARIAEEALKWDKEKYQNNLQETSRCESSKSQMQSDLADKNLNWERERFDKENARLVEAEKVRVESERIQTRREVMQACQMKGMSVQEMKDYMDLLFAK